MIRVLWLSCVCCLIVPSLLLAEPPVPARQLWEQGQDAMRQGKPDVAIACYRASLAADPQYVRNHLSLAAAYLEKGLEAEACLHLSRYLEACPEQLGVRVHQAELLYRLRRLNEARDEFERFIGDAQQKADSTPASWSMRHSKLMQIATEQGDEYQERLHRGIGLYLLAHEKAGLPDSSGELSTEGLFCKAAYELKKAHEERPNEARPCWYLYLVWSALAQRQPAQHSLHQAEAAVAFSFLTRSEGQALQMALLRSADETLRR